MTYTRNQPVATDFLSVSQPILTQNTNGIDDALGVDHYSASNTGGLAGMHNVIQSVPNTAFQATTINPMTYGYSLSTDSPGSSIPSLLMTQGINDAQPTPLTRITSGTFFTLAAAGNQSVLNFLNSPTCYGSIMFTGYNASNVPIISYYAFYYVSPSILGTNVISATGHPTIVFSGSTLIIQNALGSQVNHSSYTLEFQRIQLT